MTVVYMERDRFPSDIMTILFLFLLEAYVINTE